MPRKVIKKAKEDEQKEVPESKSGEGQLPGKKERDAFIASLKKQNMLGDIHKKVDLIPTGSWTVNRLIGDGTHKDLPGGIPRGFFTELCGDESTGKTTLALTIAKQVLLSGEPVIYADFEQSLRLQLNYVQKIGIDTTSPNFIHLTPTNLQDGAQAIGKSLVMVRPALIVIDSVAAMVPKEVMENDAGDAVAIGRHARLMGSFINWLGKKLQKYNCAVLLINQFRSNIKSSQYDPGPTQITTGGKALQYFIGLRIRLKKTNNKEEITEKSKITGVAEKKCISQEVKVVIEKNKVDMPWKSGPLYIVFGTGIDNVMSIITLGVNLGVIKKSAGYFTWKDPTDTYNVKVNGKQALKKYFIENPKAFEAIQPFLMLSRDDSEMDETLADLESQGVDNLTPEQLEQLKEIRKIKGISTDDIDLSDDQKNDLAELDGFGGEDSQEGSED